MGLVGAYTMLGAAKGMTDVLAAEEKERLLQARMAAQEQLNIRSEERQHTRQLSLDATKRQRDREGRLQDAQEVTERASEIAAGRRVADPETDAMADSAAHAYNAALERGEITQADANLGYAAAAEYRNLNAKPDTATPGDRRQAAAELGQITPEKEATIHNAEQAVTNRLLFEELRQNRQDSRAQAAEDRRDARAQAAEDARDTRLDKRLGARTDLTWSQRIRNADIDFARKKIDGLSPDEIKRRTQAYTATGRENKDYDPQLSALWKRAYRRKYGEDSWFDALTEDHTSEPAAPSGNGPTDIMAAFGADPTMRDYTLGKETPSGFEVFDANGKLVGHWTR